MGTAYSLQMRLRCFHEWRCREVPQIGEAHCGEEALYYRRGCVLVQWAQKDDIDSATAPANKIHNYEVRLLGIDRELHSEPGAIDSPYDVGDAKWVKPSEKRCHTKYKLGTVTRVVSEQTVEVDGQRLLDKVKGYVVRGDILEWIRLFIKGRRQRVVVNGNKSSRRDVKADVPQ